MPADIRFVNRSLLDGLLEIYRSSRFLALGSFLLILFISSVIPLSILWLIQILVLETPLIPVLPPWLNAFLTIWSTIEVIFLIYQGYLYSTIQRHSPPPVFTSDERERVVSNALSNIKNIRQTLSKWFMDHPFEKIDRQSVVGWLAFAFYSKRELELNDRELEEINAMIRKLEVDHQLEVSSDTSAGRVSYMKHILDPVRVIFRPFVFYLVTDTLLNGILATSMMRWRGYQFVRMGHLSFWTYHDHTSSDNGDEEEEPIIFFHGIGAGLLMYQPFLARIHKQFARRRRLIFISMRCICMRYPTLNDIPNMSDTVDSVRLIFEYYKLKKAIFIGHSYGTACLAWIIQKCPHYISRLIFLDPICFALFEPYVIYNFVYRIPHRLGHLYMYYFVCRELGISYVISRHFWWAQNNLFLEQIPSQAGRRLPTHVLLSGHDCIVNVHLVKDYLTAHGVDYYWAPKLSHGGYMHNKASWERICQWMS